MNDYGPGFQQRRQQSNNARQAQLQAALGLVPTTSRPPWYPSTSTMSTFSTNTPSSNSVWWVDNTSQTGSTATTALTTNNWVHVTNSSTTTTGGTTNVIQFVPTSPIVSNDYVTDVLERIFKVREGRECDIQLPDGSVIRVDSAGSYQIDDKDAKVIYRANRVRDFNKFINVSDRMEEFFAFCGEQRVRPDEILDLPINLFLGWLVIEAAKADQEDPPQDIKFLPDLRKRSQPPRCRCCGQFIRHTLHRNKIDFCGPPCFEKSFASLQPQLAHVPQQPAV